MWASLLSPLYRVYSPAPPPLLLLLLEPLPPAGLYMIMFAAIIEYSATIV